MYPKNYCNANIHSANIHSAFFFSSQLYYGCVSQLFNKREMMMMMMINNIYAKQCCMVNNVVTHCTPLLLDLTLLYVYSSVVFMNELTGSL